ncbi:MAG: hypothetical protein WC523_00680 [Patescibacteria group bacterium]
MRIGLSSSNSIISKAIKWLTCSKVSHSYIVFCAADEELVINAAYNGVICEHYELFKRRTSIMAEFEILLTPEEEHRVLSYSLKQLTKSYDFLAILGLAWVFLNKHLGRKVCQPFSNKSAYFCSELVICSLQSANFPLSHFMYREATSPEDVIEFLISHPRAKLVRGGI